MRVCSLQAPTLGCRMGEELATVSRWSRRRILVGAAGATALAGAALFRFRRSVRNFVSARTRLASFSATPPLIPHDPARDATTIAVSQGKSPETNVDLVLDKLGGIGKFVGDND